MSKENSPQNTKPDYNTIYGFVAKKSGAKDGNAFNEASKSCFKSEPERAKNAYNIIASKDNPADREAELEKFLSPENEINDTSFQVFAHILKGIFGVKEATKEEKQEALDRIFAEFAFLGKGNGVKEGELENHNTKEDFERSQHNVNYFSHENSEITDAVKKSSNEINARLIKEEIARNNEQQNEADKENVEQKKEKQNQSSGKQGFSFDNIFDDITYKDVALGGLTAGFLASVPFTGPVGLLFAGLSYSYAVANKSAENAEKKAIMKQVYENKDIRKLLDEDKNAKKFFEEAQEKDPDLKKVVEEIDAKNLNQNTTKEKGEIVAESLENDKNPTTVFGLFRSISKILNSANNLLSATNIIGKNNEVLPIDGSELEENNLDTAPNTPLSEKPTFQDNINNSQSKVLPSVSDEYHDISETMNVPIENNEQKVVAQGMQDTANESSGMVDEEEEHRLPPEVMKEVKDNVDYIFGKTSQDANTSSPNSWKPRKKEEATVEDRDHIPTGQPQNDGRNTGNGRV